MCVVGICGGCVDVWLCSTGMLLKLLCILLRHSMCIVICMCAQGCVIFSLGYIRCLTADLQIQMLVYYIISG